METIVTREIADLKTMARNWKRGFKTWITPGDNEYVFEEFREDIFMHAVPYISRLVETKYIDLGTASTLIGYFLNQIEELREYAKGLESGDS